jgi:hypothetical protein
LADYIQEENLDMCAITEIWLSDTDRDNIEKGNLTPTGYSLLHTPRAKGRGGGVTLVFKQNLKATKQTIPKFVSFECMEVLIKSSINRIWLTVVCRPLSTSKSLFVEEFESYVIERLTTSGHIIIVGDFNFHLENENDADTYKLCRALYTLGLEQHISKPTHVKGHLLDLLITRANETPVYDIVVQGSTFSDHFPVTFKLPWKKPAAPQKTVTYRKLKDMDVDAFSSDLRESSLIKSAPDDLSALVQLYDSTLTKLLDKHAPAKSKRVTLRPSSGWFNSNIQAAKRKRRQAERKWRKTNLSVHLDILKAAHENVTSLCADAKAQYYCHKLEECKGDQKAVFKVGNSLLHRQKVSPLPCYESESDLAERFCTYFSDKIKTIRDSFSSVKPQTAPLSVDGKSPPQFTEFHMLEEDELSKMITSGNSKSGTSDPIPTSLVKTLLPTLLPTLLKIVNTSLRSSTMPSELKCATVKPLLKKASLDPEDLRNYRPVSNLTYISKLIEGAAITQMDVHVMANKLHQPLQSAYKTHHSVETAILKVTSDIQMDIDNKLCVMLVLLDLSAAFDTIDQDIFLERIKSDCGIAGSPHDWLQSYFTDRYQSVCINGDSSAKCHLTTGFPQGSKVGPFGFKRYTPGLVDIAKKHGIKIHLYADDTQLYLSFHPNQIQQALSQMEACIEEIRLWMNMNFLKLNEGKTEFVFFHSMHHKLNLSDYKLHIGKDTIGPTNYVKNLGVSMDLTLGMDRQVAQIIRSCYCHIRGIWKIRKSLTEDATKQLVHAFVASRLDNANSLLYGLPDTLLDKLQVVQNNAARVIKQLKRSDHITPTLKMLHWLPIKSRIVYKIALFVYKALHGEMPEYITDMINLYCPPRTLRSSIMINLAVPETKPHLKYYGCRSFYHAAPAIWNGLPMNLKNAENTNVFKKGLKTYLFEKAY